MIKYMNSGLTIIAGPCTIESREQLTSIAKAVKDAGADILRGGAYKPRTLHTSFQGLGKEGLDLLAEAKKSFELPTVSEIMDADLLGEFADVDILQVGAKNMQNYTLLRALGRQSKPVLLKRHFGATIDEFIASAEYITSEGNPNVILCERGIRSFNTDTRFSLDLSIIPIIKQKTRLPIIVDPSHATGRRDLIAPMSKAAVAAGADGIMIEVHDHPECALCDGPQAITTEEFKKLAQELRELKSFLK